MRSIWVCVMDPRIIIIIIFILCSSFLSLPLIISANTEVDALIALRTKLVDPDNVLESWDKSFVNPCTWIHVTCNAENTVTRIDLGNAKLSGSLVPQLGLLRNLQYLELYGNKISGRIPGELGKLRKLVSLDLYQNQLSGPIPDSLGNLQMLRFLRLNRNRLSGHIPMSLTTINTLQVLDLSYNMLTGPIPNNGSFMLFTPISFYHNHLDPSPSPRPNTPPVPAAVPLG